MIRNFLPIVGMILHAGLLSNLYGQTIDRKDFAHPKDGLPGELRCEKSIEIGPHVTLPAIVDVTAKGNGILTIANLKLRVWDEHDDSDAFEGGLLHVEFADVTGDGYRDLVICGTLKHTGEKRSEPTTLEPIALIYVFDAEKREFALRYRCGIALER